MTTEERLNMLRKKKAFIDSLNTVFQIRPRTHSVDLVEYELYTKYVENEDAQDYTYYQEYLVVTFKGGAKNVRNINGNSDTANFRELGQLINGGYYKELEFYNNGLKEYGFTKVDL